MHSTYSISPFSILPPSPQGLGIKFAQWRPQQLDNIADIMACTTRFFCTEMPVGSGKSLAYIGYALATGSRVVVCTVSNNLLAQLQSDFPGLVALVKGRANYRCMEGGTCEDGNETGCEHRRTVNCPYHCAWSTAKESPVVITNYSYMIAISQFGEGLGPRDILIMDEGHEVPELVCDTVAVHISYDLARATKLPAPKPGAGRYDFQTWVDWGAEVLPTLTRLVSDLTDQIKGGDADRDTVKKLIAAKKLGRGLTTVVAAGTAGYRWAVDGSEQAGGRWWYTLTPVWSAPYVEPMLFRGVQQVLIYSATITTQITDLLGIPPADLTFHAYESAFPIGRMPVWYIPTVGLRKGASDESIEKWVARIDEIIAGRLDRKGLIHSVSYGRAAEIKRLSKYGHLMITHSSDTTNRAIELLKQSPAPCVLVSPVITTGYDFAGPLAEYQIICKVPYPPVTTNLMRARCGEDYPKGSVERVAGDNYKAGIVARIIVQSDGRIKRYPQDEGETFIIDSQFGFFLRAYRRYFSPAFLRNYGALDRVPAAPTPSLYTRWLAQRDAVTVSATPD